METKQTKENRHQWRRNFYCNSNIIRVKKIHYILWSSLLPSGMCFNIMSMLYSFLYPQCPSNFRTYEHEFQLRSMWIPSNLPKVMKLISQKWKKKRKKEKWTFSTSVFSHSNKVLRTLMLLCVPIQSHSTKPHCLW